MQTVTKGVSNVSKVLLRLRLYAEKAALEAFIGSHEYDYRQYGLAKWCLDCVKIEIRSLNRYRRRRQNG